MKMIFGSLCIKFINDNIYYYYYYWRKKVPAKFVDKNLKLNYHHAQKINEFINLHRN